MPESATNPEIPAIWERLNQQDRERQEVELRLVRAEEQLRAAVDRLTEELARFREKLDELDNRSRDDRLSFRQAAGWIVLGAALATGGGAGVWKLAPLAGLLHPAPQAPAP